MYSWWVVVIISVLYASSHAFGSYKNGGLEDKLSEVIEKIDDKCTAMTKLELYLMQLQTLKRDMVMKSEEVETLKTQLAVIQERMVGLQRGRASSDQNVNSLLTQVLANSNEMHRVVKFVQTLKEENAELMRSNEVLRREMVELKNLVTNQNQTITARKARAPYRCHRDYVYIAGGCYQVTSAVVHAAVADSSLSDYQNQEKVCKQLHGGRLISIETPEERQAIYSHLLNNDYSVGWYCTSGSKIGGLYRWENGAEVLTAEWCDTSFQSYCREPTKYSYVWLYKDTHKVHWMSSAGGCRPICETEPY